jgi:hypothetical protein
MWVINICTQQLYPLSFCLRYFAELLSGLMQLFRRAEKLKTFVGAIPHP